MRIALFKFPHGGQTVMDEPLEKYTSAIRISEYVDVEFPRLPDFDENTAQLAALEKERADAADLYQRTLARIEKTKADLQGASA